MRNLFKIQITSLSLGFVYLFLISCTLNGNYLGVSRSVNESKKGGFLIDEYAIVEGDFNIDCIGEPEILEVFIENKWRSNNNLSKTKTRGYQMVIKFKGEIPKKYSFDWVCKIEAGKTLTENDKFILVADIFMDQMKDTVKINVFQGDVFYLDSLNYPKNELIFARKN